MIERHGTRAVFIARLLPLARTFVSLPAGARHIRLIPFIALTTLGCALWATGFVATGLVLGTAWATVGSMLGRGLLVVGLVTIVSSVLRSRRALKHPRGIQDRGIPALRQFGASSSSEPSQDGSECSGRRA